MDAALFGVDSKGTEWDLGGSCARDAHSMADFLIQDLNFEPSRVSVYTDRKNTKHVTSRAIMRTLSSLARKSREEKTKEVWLMFSGHGTQVKDKSGDEVEDGLDEAICSSDGVITDDELFEVFQDFDKKTRIVCVFDSCHSGSIGDLKFQMAPNGQIDKLETQKKYGTTPANVLVFAACRDKQYATTVTGGKDREYGAMITFFLQCLKYRRIIDGPQTTVQQLLSDIHKHARSAKLKQTCVATCSQKLTKHTPMFLN